MWKMRKNMEYDKDLLILGVGYTTNLQKEIFNYKKTFLNK